MLEVVKLNSGYGRNVVLHNTSFRVGENEIVAIIENSGARKTTTLRPFQGYPSLSAVRSISAAIRKDTMVPSEIS